MDKKILRDISYGMYIVTTSQEENKVGCVINTLTQITSVDPIITISLNKNNYTNQILKNSKKFAVSILSQNTKKEVIGTFGYHSSKDIDKFEKVEYELVDNLPVLKEETIGYLIAQVENIIDCNTHDIFIAKVITTKKENDNQPMTYQYYHEHLKGTSPKNAPTYVEPTEIEEKSSGDRYQCSLCGYIYDDAKEKIKFTDLPDDWQCPLCRAPKSLFKKIVE